MPLFADLKPVIVPAATDLLPVEQADGVVRKLTAQQLAGNASSISLPLSPAGTLYGGTGVGGAAQPVTIAGVDGVTVTFDPTTGALTLSGAASLALLNASAALLPTTQPAPGGGLWINENLICIA